MAEAAPTDSSLGSPKRDVIVRLTTSDSGSLLESQGGTLPGNKSKSRAERQAGKSEGKPEVIEGEIVGDGPPTPKSRAQKKPAPSFEEAAAGFAAGAAAGYAAGSREKVKSNEGKEKKTGATFRVIQERLERYGSGYLDASKNQQEIDTLLNRRNELLEQAQRNGLDLNGIGRAIMERLGRLMNDSIEEGRSVDETLGDFMNLIASKEAAKAALREVSKSSGSGWGEMERNDYQAMIEAYLEGLNLGMSLSDMRVLGRSETPEYQTEYRRAGFLCWGDWEGHVAANERLIRAWRNKEDTKLNKQPETNREETPEPQMSSMWNFKVERKPAEFREHDIFDDRFVTDHKLPHEIFSPPPLGETVVHGQDVATLLKQIFLGGTVMPGLSWESIVYTLRGMNLTPGELGEKTNKAWYALGELKGAIIPLMIARFKTGQGTLVSLCGRDGAGGVLNVGEGNLDLREIIPAFRNDESAKRALAILLAADGYRVGSISPEDQGLADKFKPRFKEIVEKGVTKEGRPALNKEFRFTQRECAEYMDVEVARDIAEHLNCDIGRVDLMVMLYTALGGGQRVIDFREAYQRFPVLRQSPKEIVMKPMLWKLKIGDGKYSFGYVESQLASERGVDAMFDALLLLRDGHDLWKYWAGLDKVFTTMKSVDDLQTGNDNLPDASARRKEIAKLLEPLAAGDPPSIHRDTLELIKKMDIYDGIGQNAEAGSDFATGAKADAQYAFDRTGLTALKKWFIKNYLPKKK